MRISVYWTCTFGANEDRRGRAVKTALLSEVQRTLARLPLRFSIERRPVLAAAAATAAAPPPPLGADGRGNLESMDGSGVELQEQGEAAVEGQQQQQALAPHMALIGARVGKGAGGGVLKGVQRAVGAAGATWPGAVGTGGGARAAPVAAAGSAAPQMTLPSGLRM